MERFATLYAALDATTKTNAKVKAMVDYFADVPAEDAAWAVFFLTGERLKRMIRSGDLRRWATDLAHLPDWLVDDCYASVGDTAETVALILDVVPGGEREDLSLARWMEDRILPLRESAEDRQKDEVTAWWQRMDRHQRFVLNKLLTGGFRVGVSKLLVTRALAEVSGLDTKTISHRLMGRWQPSASAFEALLAADDGAVDIARPYPFFLASQLNPAEPETLGDVAEWYAEWKWDGIRAQIVRRQGQCFIWSRGEDLITERFPEIETAAAALPDGIVLDGEILAWNDDGVLPFAVLQKRIGRLKLGPKILKDAPVRFLAYDILEWKGVDQRDLAHGERREALVRVIDAVPPALGLSPFVETDSWAALGEARLGSRTRRVEGLMLKRRSAAYQVGRRRGDWWKWKIDPLAVDAVLLYAQAGSGRRANLFTDYTFGVWQDDQLVPFAKAYSGLDNAEIDRLDRWIRKNTLERFGPVRAVPAAQVFEIAFEGINSSTRHKSGVAVRFPRIARWRTDKTPEQADTLDHVKSLVVD
ncbi:MAG: ATP-dependent DNA ligase [Geminicoccaceae bacterium]